MLVSHLPLGESGHLRGQIEASMALFLRVLPVVSVTVASGASLVACTWLLVKLSSGTAGFRNRLFPTQLRWLAFVDMCFSLSTLTFSLTDVLVSSVSSEVYDVVCTGTTVSIHFFRYLSLWIEMHLAVSFALQSFKMRRVTLMYRCLPCVVCSRPRVHFDLCLLLPLGL